MPADAQEHISSKDPLNQRCTEIAAEFSSNPPNINTLFSPHFLDSVPESQIRGLFRQYFEKYGRVVEVNEIKRSSDQHAVFELTFAKGFQAQVDLTINQTAPRLIEGLWIGVAAPIITTLDNLSTSFAGLKGKASFVVAKLNQAGETILASYHPGDILPIGSAFKLFVLGTLIRDIGAGERHWSDIVRLRNTWKSLPSGFLQEWPNGSPLTLQTLATLMISQSDNTAADVLIHVLGRKHVEETMSLMGIRPDESMKPFLTTREMFLLKDKRSSASLDTYLAMNEPERRTYLKKVIAHENIKDALPWDLTSNAPSAVDSLEWFASSKDMTSAMAWIWRHTANANTRPARDILAINPGIAFDRELWPYVGFKGGSEPGVLNLTFLLQSKSKGWYVMSASWMNTGTAVDDERLAGLVTRAADLINPDGGELSRQAIKRK